MIQFNYPEMMQEIKMQIFTADHSAIYSLACAVACIAASFGIIDWYNRMMNEPYGRLDMAAVIKTGAVLMLTCSFYTTVLTPIDYVTHLITKGICAAVDTDRDGMHPLDEKVDVLGASSDHLILDVTRSDKEYQVGDTVRFTLDYGAVLRLATSEYVEHEYI